MFPLCTIVDTDVAANAGWAPIDLAEAFLNGGARFLQLRAKTVASGPFLDLATAIAERARAAGATLIVNDRADIARLSGADGVHVGQDDLRPDAARAIVGDAAIVGLSTHTVEQVERASRSPITYAAIGPVFSTSTKATGYDAIGLDGVRAAASLLGERDLPLVAIGGITLDTAPAVLAAGARSVAVVSDLLSGGNPEARVREYIRALSR
jgi:thiamine-phosphate pyrophosphorylase